MRIRLSQLRQIIKEETRRALNENEAEDQAPREVPAAAVKHVLINYFENIDGPNKWRDTGLMEDAVQALLTNFGYKTPGKGWVDHEDLDYVKRIIRADPLYLRALHGPPTR